MICLDCDRDFDSENGSMVCPACTKIMLEQSRIDDELKYLEREALGVYTPEGVKIWIDAPNGMLDGLSPRELVKRGRTMEAVNLLEALGEGVFM